MAPRYPDSDWRDRQCLNCGHMLQGPWCHHCGQPVKGMVRHFTSIIGDVADTLFEYDGRIWRTLVPLYFRPGRITCDFIAGRRMRYVLPFRLFFVLSVVTFLMLQFVFMPQGVGFNLTGSSSFADLDTRDAVISERDEAISELEQTLRSMEADPLTRSAAGGVRTAIAAVYQDANRRLEELGFEPEELPENVRASRVTPPDPGFWIPGEQEIDLAWLPRRANDQLNIWAQRAATNIERAGEDPSRLTREMFNLLPVVLFVLMPVFALLLKCFYILSGRLYMEHLIVALHSHSFLFLGILISGLLALLGNVLADVAVAGALLNFLFQISLAWLLLYLLLMQKRVYGQGWGITVFKYFALGSLYSVLIVLGVISAAVISLVIM